MVNDLSISSLLPQQIEAVIKLWKDCGLLRPWNDPERDINFVLQSPCACILVGSLHELLIASVMAGHDGHRGVLYYLAVSPACQKQGFGARMVAAAEDWLKDQGVWKINLLVRSENNIVSSFYEKLGYELNPAISFGKRI